ncbi:MAG TPA: hypothetical protein VFU14_14985 [Acidimicrobiales bacterium]|nr:hypothetical protein [Acidimicrobiales bacterium]
MTRRRLSITAAAALVAVGTLGASAATADTVPTSIRASDDDYILCAGVRVVPVATCVREPIGPILDIVIP